MLRAHSTKVAASDEWKRRSGNNNNDERPSDKEEDVKKKKSKLITPLLHPWKTGQRLGRSTICMYRIRCECHRTMVSVALKRMS